MTQTSTRVERSDDESDRLDVSLTAGTLPPSAPLIGSAVAVVAAAALVLPFSFNIGLWVLLAFVLYTAGIYVVSRRVEGRRAALDRVVTAVVCAAFALAMLPLVGLMYTVVVNGAARFDTAFFTETMRNVLGEGGGVLHAIYGTLVITGLTSLISIPIGILVAIYLVEYGRGRLARSITLFIDVMTGIPSIVAGLFAYALFVIVYGAGTRSGLAGAVALSVLMIPVVVRSAEEMLRLVPRDLREAAFALGVPRWKTIIKIVLPTAIAGIVTGITLSIARVIGETAPLLITAGFTADTNLNPLDGRMTTLPVFTYFGYQTPGFPPQPGYDRAWTGALVLMLIVIALFTVARIIAKVFQPKGLR